MESVEGDAVYIGLVVSVYFTRIYGYGQPYVCVVNDTKHKHKVSLT